MPSRKICDLFWVRLSIMGRNCTQTIHVRRKERLCLSSGSDGPALWRLSWYSPPFWLWRKSRSNSLPVGRNFPTSRDLLPRNTTRMTPGVSWKSSMTGRIRWASPYGRISANGLANGWSAPDKPTRLRRAAGGSTFVHTITLQRHFYEQSL